MADIMCLHCGDRGAVEGEDFCDSCKDILEWQAHETALTALDNAYRLLLRRYDQSGRPITDGWFYSRGIRRAALRSLAAMGLVEIEDARNHLRVHPIILGYARVRGETRPVTPL